MNKIYKVHSFYILTILISIIILLTAIKWGTIENLVNLISFALTITSLVLAILAIIYAVYSNNSFSSNITKLDIASEKINNSATVVSNLSDTLLEKIDQIPIILNSIEQKTDATQVFLAKLNFPNDTTHNDNFNPNKIDFENFIYQNSNSGQTLLYMLYLSLKTKKEFSLQEICDKYSLGYDYYYGFFVAVQTLRIIKYNGDYKDKQFYYQVLEMNSYIKEHIVKLIEDIKKQGKKDDSEKLNESFRKNINDLEDFFK